jgi:hypothetical protein
MMDDELKKMSVQRLDLFSTALKIMKWIANKPTHKAFNLQEIMDKFKIKRDEAYRIMDRIVAMHPGRIVKCKYGMRTLYVPLLNLNDMSRRDYDNKHMAIRRLKKLKIRDNIQKKLNIIKKRRCKIQW